MTDGPGDPWVMGQELNGSLGSWVTLSDPFPALRGIVVYNSAAGRFHTKNLCSRLYSVEVNYYLKNEKKSLFERPFGGLRGSLRTPPIARWKARGQLPIRRN